VSEIYRKPYLDSSVFLAWIKGETINGIPRGEIARHILNRARMGDYLVYTSTWTLAEVHKMRAGPILPEDDNERILSFFENEFIVFVEVDRLIGEHANRLCREHSIRPGDAVHHASALRAKCDVLLLWDPYFGSIIRPDIRIEEPEIQGQTELPNMPESAN
jgi:predicted nucleic acid-binding protein